MTRFKPGDKVRVIKDSVDESTYDEEGIVIDDVGKGYRVKMYGTSFLCWDNEVYPSEDYTPKDIKEVDHYRESDIECVDYLWDNMPVEAFIGGLEWNVKKYLHRWRRKNAPVQDLRKARDYLTVLIDVMEGKEPKFKEWDK